MEQSELQSWAKRSILKCIKNLEVPTLPEKLGESANVFLEQHMQDLVEQRPQLFQLRNGKVFKIFRFGVSPLVEQ